MSEQKDIAADLEAKLDALQARHDVLVKAASALIAKINGSLDIRRATVVAYETEVLRKALADDQ
jgi:hypothetical protein